MEDYVSDSDKENYQLLKPSAVSDFKFNDKIRRLESPDRKRVKTSLESTQFYNLLDDRLESEDGSESDISSGSGARENGIFTEGISMSSVEEQTLHYEKNYLHDATTLDNQVFNGGENKRARRALRKRNFSSTHPYIADQAHWLGLISIELLNEMYREREDVETIVKYLNKVYLKNKKRYSNDDKYKQRNFYAYLGGAFKRLAQTHQQAQTPYSSQDDSAKISREGPDRLYDSYDSCTSPLDSVSYDSDYGSDDEVYNRQLKEEDIMFLNPSSEESDHREGLYKQRSNMDSIDIVELQSFDIQVNDAQRTEEKEADFVKGILPYSLEKLSLDKSLAAKPVRTEKVERCSRRKGLAYKKLGMSKVRCRPSIENDNFIDDAVYYENFLSDDDSTEISSLTYKPKPQLPMKKLINSRKSKVEAGNIIEHPQDYSGSDENIQFGKFEGIAPKNPSSSNDYFDQRDDEATESDRIDLQLAFSRRKGRKMKLPIRIPRSGEYEKNGAPVRRVRNRAFAKGSRNLMRTRNLSVQLKKSSLREKRSVSTSARKKLCTNGFTEMIENTENSTRNPKSAKTHKQLLQDMYVFKRNPSSFTPVLEVEKKAQYNEDNLPGENDVNLNSVLHAKFEDIGDILKLRLLIEGVDLTKLNLVKCGEFSLKGLQVITFTVDGRVFILSLFDQDGWQKILVDAINHIACHLIPNSISVDTLKDLRECFEKMIRWVLCVQAPLNMPSWASFGSLFESFSRIRAQNKAQHKLSLFCFSIILFFIFIQIAERNDASITFIEEKNSQLENVCKIFWQFYLDFDWDFWNIASELTNDVAAVEFNPLLCIYSLSICRREIWWECITCSLMKVEKSIERFDIIAYKLLFLAFSVPAEDHDWAPFCIFYGQYNKSTDVDIHLKYLEIIEFLNERQHWPLEEQLIMSFYSVITHRKFANFDTEVVLPKLLDEEFSQQTLPTETFFDNFLCLINKYLSALPFGTNKKRIISKLFTSSHFQYLNDRKGHSIFLNRFNFILLLLKVSSINLTTQVQDLIGQILSSKDLKFLDVSVKGLNIFSRIAKSKEAKLSTEGYFLILEELAKSYSTLPGAVRLLDTTLNDIEEIILDKCQSSYEINNHFLMLQCINRLDFFSFVDEEAIKIFKVVLKAIENVFSAKERFSTKQFDIIEQVSRSIFHCLNYEMGRFSITNKLKDERLTLLVELLIKIWTKTIALSRTSNWSAAIHQKYSYMGNALLRETFILFLYLEIIKYSNFYSIKDDIMLSLLRALASHSGSRYLSPLFGHLMRLLPSLFNLKELGLSEKLTSFEFQRLKIQITCCLLSTIDKSNELSKAEKRIYLEGFFESLNKEYARYHQDEWFTSYCKKIVKDMTKPMLTNNLDVYLSLCKKLGILQFEFNPEKWYKMAYKERLAIIHDDFVSAVFYQREVFKILEKYTSFDSIECVYHLLSIYLKCISSGQLEYWVLMSRLMEYISFKIHKYEILPSEASFVRFFHFLILICYYFKKTQNNVANYTLYHERKVLASVFNVLEVNYLSHDGYKDQQNVTEFISHFLELYENKSVEGMCPPSDYYSEYILFDIQRRKETLAFPYEEILTSDMEELLTVLQNAYYHLKYLVESPQFIETLDYILNS